MRDLFQVGVFGSEFIKTSNSCLLIEPATSRQRCDKKHQDPQNSLVNALMAKYFPEN